MPDIFKKLGGFKEKITNQLGQPEKMPVISEVEKKVEIEQPVSLEEGKLSTEQKEVVASIIPTRVSPITTTKSPILEKIEDVLEEDLEDIYFQLPPDKQAEFKKSGEKTASSIELLLRGTKVKIKKILELIINWLKIVPGVNRFFLEQEAKIKTDKILALKEANQNKENQNKI
jgi:hypothetical protein